MAARLRLPDFPDSVRSHAKRVAADTLGAIAAGARAPEVTALASGLSEFGLSLAIGHRTRATPRTAALLNGTAGTWLELDEGHHRAGGHPAIHTLPAAYAAAEARDASGEDLLTAFILGYEIGGRIGAAARLREAVHPHGTWGVVAAAVAAGKLAGFDAARFTALLDLCPSLAIAATRRAAPEGATVRNGYAGVAAQLGLLACELVQSGFTGPEEGAATVFGEILGAGYDAETAFADFGRTWMIEDNFLKPFGCCRETHGAVCAVEQAWNVLPLDERAPEKISGIALSIFPAALELAAPAPVTPLAARFSIPFAVATWLHHGHAWSEAFEAPALANPAIRALARAVTLNPQPAPGRRTTAIIVMRSGTKATATVETETGDAALPLSAANLRSKFARVTAGVFAAEEAPALFAAMEALETLPSVRALSDRIERATL